MDANFVWRMEDILDLYAQPNEPDYPIVNFDEVPYQLVSETRIPLPPKPGQPQRYDFQYKREGTCNLFVFLQALSGWRHVKVTDRRTKTDFAFCMKDLVDIHFPQAKKIRVVLDNLNTHTPAALYETFEPEEARRILRKLEFHYTPKHASWLNMVEIEIAVLSRQCLDRRIGNRDRLLHEIDVWQQKRNAQRAGVNWRFTASDARVKLKRLYPSYS